MSSTPLRVFLLTLFIVFSYILWHKQSISLTPTLRNSRWRQKSNATLTQSHIGALSTFQLNPKPLFEQSSVFEWLSFDKKVNTYYFNFYNWYYFQIKFADLGYQSNVQFRAFTEDYLDQRWNQRVGFTLPDSFYPDGGIINLTAQSYNQPQTSKPFNLDFKSNVFNISVSQYTINNLSNQKHDGYTYSRFWYYTPNKSLDDPQNQAFKSNLTITTFRITYLRDDLIFHANLTHVQRHNQCFSVLEEENQGVVKHSCYGGYGNGKINIERKIKHRQCKDYGKWVKSVYHLDKNRTRTYFQGLRSTTAISKQVGGLLLPKTNWHWRNFKVFVQGFSKIQYYSKYQRIEKERYIGLHFSRPFAHSQVEIFEDYFFFNGKIHPIYAVDYAFREEYAKGQNITFKAAPVQQGKWQPDFEVNFTVLGTERFKQSLGISIHKQIRAYGYWSGYVDEGERGERVDFFNITGFIQTTSSIY